MLLVSGIERLKTKPGFFRWLDRFVIITVLNFSDIYCQMPAPAKKYPETGGHILHGRSGTHRYFTIRVCFFDPCFRVPVLECFFPGSSTSARTDCTVPPIKVGFTPRRAFPIAPSPLAESVLLSSGWLGYPWLPPNFNQMMQGRCDPIPFSFALGACFCHFKMEVRKIQGMAACHTGMRSHGLADRLTRPIFGSKSPERSQGFSERTHCC